MLGSGELPLQFKESLVGLTEELSFLPLEWWTRTRFEQTGCTGKTPCHVSEAYRLAVSRAPREACGSRHKRSRTLLTSARHDAWTVWKPRRQSLNIS